MADLRDPTDAIEYMLQAAPRYAKAKAERVYLEHFLKTKRALLMQQSQGKTVADREAYALAHPEYQTILDGIKVAVEGEETLRFRLKATELEVEVWRSREASNRAQDRGTR